MEVFRIAKQEYASSLSASGAANRWNKRNQFVIYAGCSRALSTLELVVHRASVMPQALYKVMVISIADEDHLFSQIQSKALPRDWRKLSAWPRLQQMGSDWYSGKISLVLKVPSAVIPHEYNFLINTEHPEFAKQVTLVRTESYFWDERLA